MEIGAICNLGIPQAVPVSSEGSIDGLFGLSIQAAMENLQMANVQKDLGKGKTGQGMDLLAQLLSAALVNGNGQIAQQDVEQIAQQLLNNPELNLGDLLSGEKLEGVLQEVMTRLPSSEQSNDGLFATVYQALQEISDYAKQAQTLGVQIDQNTVVKAAGEMRINNTPEPKGQGEGMIPAESQGAEDTVIPVAANQQAEPAGEQDSSLAESKLPKDNGTLTVKAAKTEPQDTGERVMVSSSRQEPIAFRELVVSDNIETSNLSRTILEQIETGLHNQTNQLFIRLKPDTLGGIAMRLVMSEEGLVARIVTNNTQTQAALNQQISGLESALKERGIQVANIEISYNPMTDDSRKQGSSQFGQDGSKNQRGTKEISLDLEEQEEITAMYDAMMTPTEDVDGSIVYRA